MEPLEMGKVSPKKLDANRRNAQKSTGPKTEAGKNRSRQNAIKHGLLAVSVLAIRNERPDEFDHLLVSLRGEFRPVGFMEDLLVQKIAVSLCRQKRALDYELTIVPRAFTNETIELERKIDPDGAAVSDRLRRILGPELDRLLRYQTSIQRELVYSMQQLEERQMARKELHAPVLKEVHRRGLTASNNR